MSYYNHDRTNKIKNMLEGNNLKSLIDLESNETEAFINIKKEHDIRDVLNNDLSHNPKDRLKNAYRISKLCEFLTSQNIHVVCSTMSLFKEIHQMNRKNIANYYEIFVDVNIKELIKRDSKGLYSKAISGDMKNVIGIDLPYDKPENPFLTIENTNSNISIESKALHILTQVKLI